MYQWNLLFLIIIAHAHAFDVALQKQWSSFEFLNYHVHVNA